MKNKNLGKGLVVLGGRIVVPVFGFGLLVHQVKERRDCFVGHLGALNSVLPETLLFAGKEQHHGLRLRFLVLGFIVNHDHRKSVPC